MQIRMASHEDYDWLRQHDRHVSDGELHRVIETRRVLIAQTENQRVGWLRWGLFWDNTPFMNMLYLLEGWRGQGTGAKLAEHWERLMALQGFDSVLTSTQSNEDAQHFYRRLGYRDAGSLILPGEPMEIIFRKELAANKDD
ncbi:MAG: GNAT family N-acetyltransferase [Clostridia bacterium]|nr:GNAT family N-acetyltransferase [Clostridia bacterium]